MQALAPYLQRLHEQGLYRQRHIQDSMQGAEVVLDGQRCLAFCSNDYLGLSHHPDVIRALQQGAEQYGAGSGAAHLINGHSSEHHALEEELAEFTGRERALLFSTGYMANLGVQSALLERGDAVYHDRLNHASLLDGALLSGARLRRYQHNDVEDLRNKLDERNYSTQLVATDGVFSMDGDIADLPALARAVTEQQAWLLVDDAHAFGVLGEHGGGSCEHFALDANAVPILMATLGKAAGTFGAFVAGSEALIETLINSARSYIYTTAPPPAVAAATRVSLRLLRDEHWRRDRLQALIARFRDGAAELGFELMPSVTPIQPLLIGDSERAVQISAQLWQQHIYVPAIRPPTVPEGEARLRITFSADHEQAHVDRLLSALDACR